MISLLPMKRRHFLKTMSSFAPGVFSVPLAGSSNLKSYNQTEFYTPQEPRVFMFDDGRHAGGLYQMEPPLTPADHTYNVDQLANSGVDTLVYFAGVEGGTVLYDSKVAELWGTVVKKWTHYVWYRAGRVLRQLIDDGHDPLKLLCDRCHETGILMLASAWVSLHGGTRAEQEGLGRWSSFALDNPQFHVGPDPDPRAKGILTSRFSFMHTEVREERFRVFKEMLSQYETDGIELNLTSQMPYCQFSEVSQLAPLMTQWIRTLREQADKAQQAQGRRKRIYVRIPAHPASWDMVGYDIPTWVAERLVDGLFCVSSYGEDEGMDQDLDLKPIVKLTRGTKCRVLYAFHNNLGRQLARYATPTMIWAAAANTYTQGADGFGIGDHHWTPNGWPWTAQEYNTLRLLGHPELLATVNKLYHVRSTSSSMPSMAWLPGRVSLLPKELSAGESTEIPFQIADDLRYWHELGRVKSVKLRARFSNFQPHYDQILIQLNGQNLGNSTLEKVDLTYRLLQVGSIGPYGYAFDYHLGINEFPQPGRNFLKVTLLKRDPNIDVKLSLYDVDCSIEYRLHRHFESVPIEY